MIVDPQAKTAARPSSDQADVEAGRGDVEGLGSDY